MFQLSTKSSLFQGENKSVRTKTTSASQGSNTARRVPTYGNMSPETYTATAP